MAVPHTCVCWLVVVVLVWCVCQQLPEESWSKVLVDSAALRHLALNWELWGAGHNRDMFVMLLSQVGSQGGTTSQQPGRQQTSTMRLHSAGEPRSFTPPPPPLTRPSSVNAC